MNVLNTVYLFVIFQGVKFAMTSPERLEYTAEHSLRSTPIAGKKEMEKDIIEKIGLC